MYLNETKMTNNDMKWMKISLMIKLIYSVYCSMSQYIWINKQKQKIIKKKKIIEMREKERKQNPISLCNFDWWDKLSERK